MVLAGLRDDFASQPIDPVCPKLNQYLMASMGSLPDEVLRILFLDDSRRLIADEQLQRGSVRQLDLYPRTIFRRAIEHGATGLILVHNHPSGDPNPSQNDIVATRKLHDLGRTLDIEIVDHIIVTVSRTHRIAALGPIGVGRKKARGSIFRDNQRSRAGDSSSSRARAIENARRAYRRRQYRRELIGSPRLFGEPAWDMLIDLFINEREGKRVATSALCLASTVSSSTALRRVNDLCAAGLIVKIEDPADGRRHFVELMPDTASRLEAYFGAEEEAIW